MAVYHHTIPVILKQTVKETITALRRLKRVLSFEQIVCTGISGQSIAWPVGYITGIPVAVVRRKGERGHHGYDVEHFDSTKKYIILDDFISEGNTVRHMVKTINKRFQVDTKNCVGIYLYDPTSRDHIIIDKTMLFTYDKTSEKRRQESKM